jgi:hypothetical protein
MVREDEIRKAARAVEWPDATDAGLIFIGRIHSAWTSRMDCPRQGRSDGPVCRIEVFDPSLEALDGIADLARIEVFYRLHRSRRDCSISNRTGHSLRRLRRRRPAIPMWPTLRPTQNRHCPPNAGRSIKKS